MGRGARNAQGPKASVSNLPIAVVIPLSFLGVFVQFYRGLNAIGVQTMGVSGHAMFFIIPFISKILLYHGSRQEKGTCVVSG